MELVDTVIVPDGDFPCGFPIDTRQTDQGGAASRDEIREKMMVRTRAPIAMPTRVRRELTRALRLRLERELDALRMKHVSAGAQSHMGALLKVAVADDAALLHVARRRRGAEGIQGDPLGEAPRGLVLHYQLGRGGRGIWAKGGYERRWGGGRGRTVKVKMAWGSLRNDVGRRCTVKLI